MADLGALFLRAAFVENMPLTYFLGLCTFLALSRRADTAFSLGIAVILVMGVTVPLNQLIYNGVLAPGAWRWAGLPDVDLSYPSPVTFIGVVAASVQLLEMVLERFIPRLHASFGAFLPLLAIHCAIIGGSLFMVQRRYDIAEAAVYGVGSGAGFAIAVVMLGAVRTRLAYADLPSGLRGLGIAFLIAGMMSLGFYSFAQMAAQ